MIKTLPFPEFSLVIPIEVYTELPGEDGPVTSLIFSGKCNLSEKTKTIMTSDKQLVRLSGKVILKGDILPGQDIQGFIMLNNRKRVVYSTSKPRNPDGSVFSTQLELV